MPHTRKRLFTPRLCRLEDRTVPATFTVTNINDLGPGSLRRAVQDSNETPGADTIDFDPIFFATPRTISLTSGELDFTDAVAIAGPGASLATVNGNNAFEIFEWPLNASMPLAINISGLTLTNAHGSGSFGAIVVGNEQLLLNSCVFTGNTGSSAAAVGVENGGTLTATDCTFSNNAGTAIEVVGATAMTVLRRCSITGNTAFNVAGLNAIHHLLMESCTVSGNTATNFFGGVFVSGFNGATATATIRNSTISGNGAQTGGGITMRVPGTGVNTLIVQNSTITGNTASANGGGIAVVGSYGSANISLESTIVQGNIAPMGPDISTSQPIVGQETVSARNCAIGTTAGIADYSNLGGNLIGAAINLGPLADNGGPTKTHALLNGSPCINAGSNPAALTGDQRGSVGFFRTFGTGTDIGAFEFQPQAATVVNDGSVQRLRVTSLTVTLAAQVTFTGTPAAAFTLVRNSDSASVTITATASTVNGVTQVVLNGITGSAAQFGSLADGRYTLTALSSQIMLGGQPLDGDGDGNPGGNYTFGDPQGLFRFYGDINGDRHVDIADFAIFSNSFNSSAGQQNYLAYLDFNNDGHIDIADFGQFSIRFFTVLP